MLRSLARLAQGYALSAAIGVPLGIAIARSALVRSALRPFVIGLQALPSICWLPLAMLWFGLSEPAILFVVVMGSLLAIAIATEDGVARCRPAAAARRRARSASAARASTSACCSPAALPGIVTGLKLGWSFAWRALMAGELLFVAGGLGQLLTDGRELLDAAQVMGVMVAIVAIGVVVDRVLFRLARAARAAPLGPRRGDEPAREVDAMPVARSRARRSSSRSPARSAARARAPRRRAAPARATSPTSPTRRRWWASHEGSFARALGGRLEARSLQRRPRGHGGAPGGRPRRRLRGPRAGRDRVPAHARRGAARRRRRGVGRRVLVVRDARGPADLAGKRVASPQLGNTQDVALRTWLRAQRPRRGARPRAPCA